MATNSSILAWEIPWTEDPGRLHTVHGVTKSQTGLQTHTHTHPKGTTLHELPNNIQSTGSQRVKQDWRHTHTHTTHTPHTHTHTGDTHTHTTHTPHTHTHTHTHTHKGTTLHELPNNIQFCCNDTEKEKPKLKKQ